MSPLSFIVGGIHVRGPEITIPQDAVEAGGGGWFDGGWALGKLVRTALCCAVSLAAPLSAGAVTYSFGPHSQERSSASGPSGVVEEKDGEGVRGWTFSDWLEGEAQSAGFRFSEIPEVAVPNAGLPGAPNGPQSAGSAEASDDSLVVAAELPAETGEGEENAAELSFGNALQLRQPHPVSPHFGPEWLASPAFPQGAGSSVIDSFLGRLEWATSAALNSYISNDHRPGAFGFDPNIHYSNDPVAFLASDVSPTPEAATLLPLVGILLMAGGMRRFRRPA